MGIMTTPQTPWQYPDDRYYYGWYTTQSQTAAQPGTAGYGQASQLQQRQPGEAGAQSDSAIKSEIVGLLRKNTYTKDFTLQVSVQSGVVILTGTVTSALAKRAAGDDSWDTQGVVDVSNQLTVTPGA
jgi:osmotically-inducible protein OsmY